MTAANPSRTTQVMYDTPVERHAGILVKRDDLFFIGAGGYGGKVRTCYHLALKAADAGAVGLVTAGSRHSPQVNIVAGLAAELGLRCRAHVPAGPETPELLAARQAGAEIIEHRPGYNSVIVKRASDDYFELGKDGERWAEIPFGMETSAAVQQTAGQVKTLVPYLHQIQRIVVPVGSGMSLAGVLTGLDEVGFKMPVLGVQVGADPRRRLDRYAPLMWPLACELVPAEQPYHEDAIHDGIGHLRLDPVYEGKCVPFLRPGDLLWVVGRRLTASAEPTNPVEDIR